MWAASMLEFIAQNRCGLHIYQTFETKLLKLVIHHYNMMGNFCNIP